MKKLLVILFVLIVLFVGLPLVVLPLFGMSATDLKANLEVGTGIGAKLACSGRFISGQEPGQIKSDLASYTPATHLLNVQYDEARKRTTVSLFGMGTVSAQYRPGIGCTLERGDTSALDQLTVPDLAKTVGPWPAGEETPHLRSNLQQLSDTLLASDNASALQTRALLVVHNGQLVAESYAADVGPKTPLLGWSMAKSLTGIMLGHLEMLGQLDVTESQLFTEWVGSDRDSITLEDMLQMSSGLDFSEIYAPGSDATRMLFTAYSASDVALSSQLIHPPGTHFYYSSGTTNILARLLTQRLGGPQAAVSFLHQHIFAPLGMRHAILELDPSGVFVGSSYIYASGRDWARLGQLMLAEGVLNGIRVVSADWVARAQQPNRSTNDPRYGYQFWLNGGGETLRWPDLPADAYAMNGNRAQSVVIVPSADAVLVRLGWSTDGYPMNKNFAQLLAALGTGGEN